MANTISNELLMLNCMFRSFTYFLRGKSCNVLSNDRIDNDGIAQCYFAVVSITHIHVLVNSEMSSEQS